MAAVGRKGDEGECAADAAESSVTAPLGDEEGVLELVREGEKEAHEAAADT